MKPLSKHHAPFPSALTAALLGLLLLPASALRAGLAHLDAASGPLAPAFSPTTSDYTATVPAAHDALLPRLDGPAHRLFLATPDASWREALPGPVLAAGFAHSLAIRASGAVIAWGPNLYGETQVPAAAENETVAVAAGSHHSLALRRDGQVLAWGRDHLGQATVPAGATSSVVAIAAGGHQSVALRADGSVVSWGQTPALPPGAASGVVAIAAGASHVVALKADGSVISWGASTPPPAATAAEVVLVGASGQRSWARKKDGSTVVWGDGEASLLATPPPAADTALAFAGTAATNYALTPEGAVLAWGPGATGVDAPPIEAETDVVALSAGDQHVLARKRDGTLVLWGNAASGRLNAPNSARHDLALPAQTPFSVPPGDSVARLRVAAAEPAPHLPRVPLAAPNSTTVALDADGRAAAWGGLFQPDGLPASPAGYVAVAAAEDAVLLLDADGRVTAHGASYTSPALLAVPPAAESDVVAIAAASTHALALKRDGTVVAWGNTGSGALPVPELNPHDQTGGPTAGSRFTFKAVAASRNGSLGASFAIRSDARLVAWGSSSLVTNIPAAAQTDVVAVAAAEGHALVLKRDNSVVGWGNNQYGQINPVRFASPVVAIGAHQVYSAYLLADGSVHVNGGWTWLGPVPAAARSGVVAMACGPSHISVLKQDGSIVSWGQGATGAPPAGLAVLRPGPVGDTFTLGLSRPLPSTRLTALGFDVGALSPAFSGDHFSYRLVVPRSTHELSAFASAVAPGATLTTHLGAELAPRLLGDPLPLRLGDNRFVLTVSPLGPPAPRHAVAAGVDGSLAIDAEGVLLRVVGGGTSTPFGATDRFRAVFGEHYRTEYAITTEGRLRANGIGATVPESVQPTAPGVTPARAPIVAMASLATNGNILLRSDGTTQLWQSYGVAPAIPTDAQTGVVAVAAGMSHLLALRADGRVVAWPYAAPASPSPVPADASAGVVAVAAGYGWSLALRADGRVLSWGQGTTTPPTVPVAARTGVVAISASNNAAVALKADGSVVAWGTVLGVAATAPAETASGVIRVAAGYNHLLALKADGTLLKWGHVPAGSPAERLWPSRTLLAGPEQTYVVNIHRADPALELTAWRATRFSEAELADPDLQADVWGDLADPDGDGVVNLLEYATRGDPRGAAPLGLLSALDTTTPGGPFLALVYERPRNAVPAGVGYIVEWSDTLAPDTWSATGVVQTVIASSDDAETVRALVPADAPRRFARLKVSLP